MNKAERRRSLPSVDEVLRGDELAELRQTVARAQLVSWVRNAIEDCRRGIQDGTGPAAEDPREFIARQVHRQATIDNGLAQRRVINATGILLHTNLGRVPLADAAIARLNETTAYTNVELNLESGRRSHRGERVSQRLSTLTGADAALVVNNCAAATMLVLHGLAAGREVVISRGQLVEIGGGFRLPDVFAAAGVTLREVGTTNRTYLHDYELAIHEQTGVVIRVHRSNFQQTGFVTEPSIRELVTLPRPHGLAVVDDLGSGCMQDLSAFGLQEPTVSESVQAGADLTLFSGDKLFGGPQCGIIVGLQRWIDKLRTSPFARAMRVDKLTLAALDATVEIHLAGNAFAELPLLKMLSKDVATLRSECEQIVRELEGAAHAEVSVIRCDAQIGGGSVPGSSVPGCGVRISGPDSSFTPDRLAALLRNGTPAVLPRISDDALVIDLRTVADNERPELVERLRDALQRLAVDGA